MIGSDVRPVTQAILWFCHWGRRPRRGVHGLRIATAPGGRGVGRNSVCRVLRRASVRSSRADTIDGNPVPGSFNRRSRAAHRRGGQYGTVLRLQRHRPDLARRQSAGRRWWPQDLWSMRRHWEPSRDRRRHLTVRDHPSLAVMGVRSVARQPLGIGGVEGVANVGLVATAAE
jgi:hypothetical protein